MLPARPGHERGHGKKTARTLEKNPRLRIVLWASLVGLFFALCPTANSPMEDLIIAARNMVRSHRSDGRIVMVLQDDRTVAELKTSEIGREYDARVADALLKAGARRVFFQWAYTHTAGPQLDGELAEVVARYPDKIFLRRTGRKHRAALQLRQFRPA
ncbi:hypothetical protein ACFSTD_08065 [Novosphingobium colocasiae]